MGDVEVVFFRVYIVCERLTLRRVDAIATSCPQSCSSDPLLTLAEVGVVASAIAVSNARLLHNLQDSFDRLFGRDWALELGLVFCWPYR
jgi:hypothetical protein